MKQLNELIRIFEHFHEALYIVDDKRQILYFNPVAAQMSGFSQEEVIGSFCYSNILNHVDDQGINLCQEGCPLLESIHHGVNTDHYVYMHHKFGHRIRVHVRSMPLYEDGKIVGAVEVFTDETQKNQILDELQFQKNLTLIDPLTGLFNRRFLQERFVQLMKIDHFRDNLGVLFIDLDDFKQLNDKYGHQIGDDVLRSVSKTIQYNVKANDYVIRYGGEEILLFLKDMDQTNLCETAERIRILVETTILRYQLEEIKVTISIGATLLKTDESTQEAIHRADLMMYQSKIKGKNKVTSDL